MVTKSSLQTKYFWIKFYPNAKPEVVKFYTRNGIRYLKALDWGMEHELEKFGNKDYEVLLEISAPPSV
jgi:hypothetical protein